MAKRIYLQNGEYFGITDKMTGKMTSMWSINTSPSANKFCQKMQKKEGNICKNCYSKSSEGRWSGTREAWVNNGDVLSSRLLKDSEIPILSKFKNAPNIIRLQAHGDLINTKHYKNLIKLVEANPAAMFTIWSKNLKVIKHVGIPELDNLIHIYSTPLLNQLKPQLPKGFDKVFSVYSKKFIEEHSIDINCGSKKCIQCRICYSKNNITFINEKIK